MCFDVIHQQVFLQILIHYLIIMAKSKRIKKLLKKVKKEELVIVKILENK